jgi:ATP-dependent helicase Lhr and Lhr-like helicase
MNPASPPVAAGSWSNTSPPRRPRSALPTDTCIVFERFFDEAGDTHLVIHSPYGSRINRAWGLALRKRFCRRFNFELQAAALEDTIVISLGAVHSFALEEVSVICERDRARRARTGGARRAAVSGPLALERDDRAGGEALPQRPACAGAVPAHGRRGSARRGVSGPARLRGEPRRRRPRDSRSSAGRPDDDRLPDESAMDITGLERLLARIERGEVEVLCRELTSPSPLAQEVLGAKPYAFLDDAPAEERRTLAVQSRRYMPPEQAADLGRLDPAAITRVRAESWPDVRDAEELHEALALLGFLTETEGRELPVAGQRGAAEPLFEQLRDARRACVWQPRGGERLWVSAERIAELELALPDGRIEGTRPAVLASLSGAALNAEDALKELVRSRLEGLGPVTAARLAAPLGLAAGGVAPALLALEQEGFVMRGRFTDPSAEEQWCERRLLARVHRYTLKRLRSEIEPVSLADYQRFLFAWQGLGAERREGAEAVLAVLGELQGVALAAAAWERDVLPARIAAYGGDLMDRLSAAGQIVWWRPRPDGPPASARPTTVAASPIMLVPRGTVPYWRALTACDETAPAALSSHAERVCAALADRGALFFVELVELTGLLRVQVEEALGELVARGMVTADSFNGLRALLVPQSRRRGFHGRSRRRGRRRLRCRRSLDADQRGAGFRSLGFRCREYRRTEIRQRTATRGGRACGARGAAPLWCRLPRGAGARSGAAGLARAARSLSSLGGARRDPWRSIRRSARWRAVCARRSGREAAARAARPRW